MLASHAVEKVGLVRFRQPKGVRLAGEMLGGLDIRVFVEQLGDFGVTALAGVLGIGLILQIGEGLAVHRGLQIRLGLGIERVLRKGGRGGERDA